MTAGPVVEGDAISAFVIRHSEVRLTCVGKSIDSRYRWSSNDA